MRKSAWVGGMAKLVSSSVPVDTNLWIATETGTSTVSAQWHGMQHTRSTLAVVTHIVRESVTVTVQR
jgi:hypothetical protein